MQIVNKFPITGKQELFQDPWRAAIGYAIEAVRDNPSNGYLIVSIWYGQRKVAYWVVDDSSTAVSIPKDHKYSVDLWVPPLDCWPQLALHPFTGIGREHHA